MKLNALGMALALVFSHFDAVLFPVGAVITVIGLILLFLDK